MFIAVEGIDGSGTTSLCKALCPELEKQSGKRVHFLHQPDKTNLIGAVIRTLLKDGVDKRQHEVFALLFAAERLFIENQVDPLLKSGAIVLCDRHTWSSQAYQGCMLENIEWVTELNRFARNPDLYIFLDTDPETARKRRAGRDDVEEIYEKHDWQLKIAAIYDRLYQESTLNKLKIDGLNDRETVKNEALENILKYL